MLRFTGNYSTHYTLLEKKKGKPYTFKGLISSDHPSGEMP